MAVNPLAAVFVGPGGTLLTEEEIAQAKALERRKQMQGVDTSPVGHWTQGAARVADAIAGAFRRGSLDRASEANAAYDAETYGAISPDALAAPAYPASVAAGGSTFAPEATGVAGPVNVSPEIKDGIVQTASALGIDPVDLATTISYETGGTFNPTQGGPTTKWGKHRGFIQFGEPQAAQYGVDWNNPVASQLGPDGAVTKYLRDRGVKPGMGLMDIYSTINAGAPGLYNRSDAAAGGAPGTVADKVNSQMAGHRAKAMALFADAAPTNAAAAINAVAPVQTASLDPSAGMGGPLPGADQGIGGVAHEQFPPVGTTPEALTALQDRLVTEQTTPAGAMAQPPATVDVTNVDGLSAGAGLQFVAPDGQPNPLAAAVQPQAVPPSVSRVAQSLPLRAMADPNDVMVADASQTEQPVGAFPPAPAAGGGQTGPDMALLVRAATDPRASDRTKQIAGYLIKQRQAAQTAQQEAVAKRNQFIFEQQYKETLPSTEADIAAKRASTDESRARVADMVKTNDIKNYEDYAAFEERAGRTPLGPLEYRKALSSAGAPKTVSAPPAGYKNVFDADGNIVSQEPIPGGPADTSKKDAAVSDSQTTSTDVITNAAKLARKALKSPGAPATGSVGKAMAGVPESNAAELRRQVKVLTSIATIESLNQMRQQSPTGGALGNVTEGEGKMLAAKAGAIDPDSPNFERDLEDYERTLLRTIHGPQAGDEVYFKTRELPSGVTEEDISTTMKARGMTRQQVLERLLNGGS